MSADTSIDTFLDRVDARLAEIDDDGDKAIFINLCIGRAERKRERFEETLDPRYGDALQISNVLSGLYSRQAEVVKRIRERISAAEAALQKPEIAELVSTFHARRIGFELPLDAPALQPEAQ